MKKKEIDQLKNKPTVELEKELKDRKERLSKLNFDLTTGKVKNIKDIQETKKDIARILTVINKK